MYKLFLLTVLVIQAALIPSEANAGFIIAGISVVAGWLSSAGLVGFIANATMALLGTALQYARARSMAKQQDVFRELQQPESLPAYRFAYGECRVPGTPAPMRVKGDKIYACYILNSRPSQGPFRIYLDKRRLWTTGDVYDFAGGGGVGNNGWFGPGKFGPHVWVWIGRGDQTGPPARFVQDCPEFFSNTDAWRGRTVLWAIFRFGSQDDAANRWPAGGPPEVLVDGRWSLVWDPRDNQVKWSANQALCTLDALINNPVRPYPREHLWLDSFRWAADVADENFPVKPLGTDIKRFEVGGVLVWSKGSEIEDQVNPLLQAGASVWVRAFGQLGMMPATWSPPVGTISDVLSETEMVYETLRSPEEVFTEAYANFTAPDREYETATCPVYKVPGAEEEFNMGAKPLEIDLPFVQDHRRAQYICKVEVYRSVMQRSQTFLAPPEALDYLSGANVTVDFPAPYTSRNGIFKVNTMEPATDPLGDSGVGMRIPMQVREDRQSNYTWSPATEEKDMPLALIEGDRNGLTGPAFVTASSGSQFSVTSGNARLPSVHFTFPQEGQARVTGYAWKLERRVSTSPVRWVQEASGTLERDDDFTSLEGLTPPLSNGELYRIQVRSLAATSGGNQNEASAWIISNTIQASVGDSSAAPPTPLNAISVSTGIRVRFRSPNSPGFGSMDIYASDTNDPNTASFFVGPLATGRDTVTIQTETGLTSGQTRYYWARSRDQSGLVSPFSTPSISATFGG